MAEFIYMKSSSARAGFRGILENMFGQFEIRDNAPCYGHYRETGTEKNIMGFRGMYAQYSKAM